MTLTIPDEAETSLRRYPWVNWSTVAREEIERREQRSKALKELIALTKNSKMTEELALSLGEEIKDSMYRRVYKNMR